MIEFRDASVVVDRPEGRTTILHPLTLRLVEQRISILGANGSGKSTLAGLINGLIEPSSGHVKLSVKNADDTTAAELDTVTDGAAVRRTVGFLFTSPDSQLIMPTVIEDVTLSLRRTHKDKDQRRAAALDTLARFGLSQLADRSVHELSGGQKQLVAMASVLAAGPQILVADEPTTLLDLRNSRVVGDLLFSLEQQLVLVTHDLELAARAERTLVIDEGRVVFDGEPHAAVEHYRQLVVRP